MNNTNKFRDKANEYSCGRPSYANGLIDMLYGEHGFCASSTIADIGSGTGIFTRQLLEKGSAVYAVEPNRDMREKAESALSGFAKFHSVNGTAENTTLENRSADFVTVAQAFHWFDVVPFKNECSRILKPNGKIFLIWNTRDAESEINKRQELIFKRFCPSFKGFSGGIKENDDRIRLFFDDRFKYVEFENPLFYAREKFIQRSLSSSYSPRSDDGCYGDYIQALNDLFDEFSQNGILTVANKTEAYFD